MSDSPDLNKMGNLPDGTTAAQAGGFGASASEVKQGFKTQPESPPGEWSADDGVEKVRDANIDRTGFCGRPMGMAR